MTGELFFVCVIPWEVAVKQIVSGDFGYRTWNGLILGISRISRGISHSTYISDQDILQLRGQKIHLKGGKVQNDTCWRPGLVVCVGEKNAEYKNNRNSAWSTPVFTSFPSLGMLLAIGTSKAFCSPEESPHLSCGKKGFQWCGQVPFGMQVVMFLGDSR